MILVTQPADTYHTYCCAHNNEWRQLQILKNNISIQTTINLNQGVFFEGVCKTRYRKSLQIKSTLSALSWWLEAVDTGNLLWCATCSTPKMQPLLPSSTSRRTMGVTKSLPITSWTFALKSKSPFFHIQAYPPRRHLPHCVPSRLRFQPQVLLKSQRGRYQVLATCRGSHWEYRNVCFHFKCLCHSQRD